LIGSAGQRVSEFAGSVEAVAAQLAGDRFSYARCREIACDCVPASALQEWTGVHLDQLDSAKRARHLTAAHDGVRPRVEVLPGNDVVRTLDATRAPERREHRRALDRIAGTRLLRASCWYRTPPWGVIEQPDFLNMVVELETGLSPQGLVPELLALEQAAGRHRGPVRWGPRRLDLDLLVHGDNVIELPGCRVPHPRLRERAFVLVPLAELAPDLVVPGVGIVRELLAALPRAEVDAVRVEPP